MNETLKVIAKRFSCRSYTGELLSEEQLLAIGNAALASPSSRNSQHWKIIAINNKQLLDEMNDSAMEHIKANEPEAYERILGRGGKVYYNSSCMYLVLTPKDAHSEVSLDVGIVSQNIAIAATSLRLGSVIARMSEYAFISSAKGEELKKKVGWSSDYKFGMGIIVGHKSNENSPHELDPAKFTIVS